MEILKADELNKTLSVLTGKDSKFTRALVAKLPPLENPPLPFYCSMLRDDAGAIVAALVANLSATVYLGGTLVMLPVGALQDQLRTGKVTDLVVESIAEVFNNLAAVVNRTAGNPHVRASTAEKVEPKLKPDQGWFAIAAKRADFTATVAPFGELRIVLLAR